MAGLDTGSLRVFCAVADHGSVSRAAALLGETQSTLSRRLAALESDLCGRLFYRTGRGVTLTPLGERLLPRARAILRECEALLEAGRDEHASPTGAVVVGAVPGASRPLVAELCVSLRREYPRIRLQALEGYSGEVESWLAHGRIDVGIFNRYGRASVHGADLLLTSVMALVRRRDAAAAAEEVAFRGLEGVALVLPPRPNGLVSRLDDLAARQKIRLKVASEMTNPSLVQDAVARAGLATIVPLHVALRDYASSHFCIQRIVKPAMAQSTWLATTTEHPVSEAARAVLRLIRALSQSARVPVRRTELTGPRSARS
ncbi:MAG: LysR family transcriptional regulator [Lautropia sp.]